MKNKILTFLLMAVFMTAVQSCRTTRTAATSGGLEGEWTTLYAPMTIEIEKPMPMSVSGRVTMARNEYIHVSVRMIGMEMAAIYIDSDSVYFVDKYHKYLFAEPLKDVLGSRYGDLSVGDLQEIVLGKKVPGSTGARVAPADFVDTPAGRVASVVGFEAEIPHGEIEGRIEWNPKSAKWNEPGRKANFKVPGNYKPITLSGIKSMFMMQ